VCDKLILLVERTVEKDNDALIGAGFALPHFQHLCFHAHRVAVERCWFGL
jgi:hypothetical protein